jgi:hypothetical protein
VLAAVVAVIVVGLGVVSIRWWSHPALFGDHRDGFSADPAPWSHASLSAGVTHLPMGEEHQVVTFDDARAHFTVNSAAARATFSICRSRPGEGPIISAKEDLDQFCTAVRPLKPGARMNYSRSPKGEYVIVTLHPTRPGMVHLDSVQLDYALGSSGFYMRGTDNVAIDITVRAR